MNLKNQRSLTLRSTGGSGSSTTRNATGTPVTELNRLDGSDARVPKEAGEFYQYLTILKDNLNIIRRQLQYGDLYHITQSADDMESLASAINNLAPGESCIINSNETITLSGQQYHRGDVIVKMIDGQNIYIPNISSGIYVPQTIVPVAGESGVYQIPFQFSTEKSEDKTLQVSADTGAVIYGYRGTGDQYVENNYKWIFETQTVNNITILPIIKFFTETDDDVMELIELPYTLSIHENNGEVELINYTDVNHKHPLEPSIQVK